MLEDLIKLVLLVLGGGCKLATPSVCLFDGLPCVYILNNNSYGVVEAAHVCAPNANGHMNDEVHPSHR